MGTKSQISVLPKPKRAPHQQYLPATPVADEPAQGGRLASMPASPKTAAAACAPFCATWRFWACLLIVFKIYRIEERAYQGARFQTLATLAFLALPVHYLAPVPLQEAALPRHLVGRFILGLRRILLARSCSLSPQS